MSECFSKLIRRAPESGHVRRKGFRAAYAFATPGFSAAQDHATPALRRAYAVPPQPPACASATPPLRRLSAHACVTYPKGYCMQVSIGDTCMMRMKGETMRTTDWIAAGPGGKGAQ